MRVENSSIIFFSSPKWKENVFCGEIHPRIFYFHFSFFTLTEQQRYAREAVVFTFYY
jgi:hypothetical protein